MIRSRYLHLTLLLAPYLALALGLVTSVAIFLQMYAYKAECGALQAYHEFFARTSSLPWSDGMGPPSLSRAPSMIVENLALASVALFSVVSATLLHLMALRSRRVQRMENEHTAELRETNIRLLRDIAARQHAENNLRHTQHVLTVAQKIAHVGSWELDALTREMHCSDELFRICGLEPQTTPPSLDFMLGLIHPEDRAAASEAIAATRDRGQEFRMPMRIVRPDGTIRHVISVGDATRDDRQWVIKVIGSLLDVTEQKENELALIRSREELRQLAAHQERILEDQRKRIAREIHDEMGGLLTGIKAYMSVMMERAANAGIAADELLSEASDMADQASETMRKVIAELRPSVLDQLGVWEALQWHAEQTEKRTGLKCDCDISNDAAATQIDPDRSIVLFRIVQEALTNVVRHAQATRVTIRALRDGGDIVLEIEDNGKGIDTRAPTGRTAWGIVGMHERARHSGGSFDIAGMPGKGTVARLRLPIHTETTTHHD